MSCRLYSVGHSTKPLEAFIRVCGTAGVEVVCDIRRFPRSRRNPQFGRATMETELPTQGIDYEWLGSSLGGFRSGGYENWMRSEEFIGGVGRLEELATSKIVAFMCAEGLPWRCHRRFVAEALASRGHAVWHLLPDGEVIAVQARLELPNQ